MSQRSRWMQSARGMLRRTLGIDIVGVGNTTTFQHHLAQLLERNRIDLVLDVGANDGQFASRLRAIGYSGRICSFEPVSKCYATLAASAARDSKWSVYKTAMGRAPGTATINIFEASDLSSFLKPNAFGPSAFEKMKIEASEEVPVQTLDAFMKEHVAPEARVFLKMDTQGFDLEVFAGLQDRIGQVAGIVSELSLTPIYEGMPDFLQALAEFRRRGFSVSGMFPVNRAADLSLIEMDCCFVRTRPAAPGQVE